jgi:hypothetical protein
MEFYIYFRRIFSFGLWVLLMCLGFAKYFYKVGISSCRCHLWNYKYLQFNLPFQREIMRMTMTSPWSESNQMRSNVVSVSITSCNQPACQTTRLSILRERSASSVAGEIPETVRVLFGNTVSTRQYTNVQGILGATSGTECYCDQLSSNYIA